MPLKNIIDSIPSLEIIKLLVAANNFEVFTPEWITKKLFLQIENPEEFFSDPESIFIDPACKSGILLYYATALFHIYLENAGTINNNGVAYNLNDPIIRINYILKYQIFGIGISHYNATLARKLLYGVSEIGINVTDRMQHESSSVNTFFNEDIFKHIDEFNVEGNIYFPTDGAEAQRKLDVCSNNELLKKKSKYIENYVPFLDDDFYGHTKIKHLMQGSNLKKAIIISNPPYTTTESGSIKGSKNLYDLFVSKCRKYNILGSSFIIPARWMTNDGKGVEKFLNEMRMAKNLKSIIDIKDGDSVFPTTDIKGGVCILTFSNKEEDGTLYTEIVVENDKIVDSKSTKKYLDELDFIVRDTDTLHDFVSYLNKKQLPTMKTIVESRNVFGYPSSFKPNVTKKSKNNDIKIIMAKGKYGFIPRADIKKNTHLIDKYKVIVQKALGSGKEDSTLNKYAIAEPGVIITETFLVLFSTDSKEEAMNCKEYLNLDVNRMLVEILKSTQNITKDTFGLVPLIDFTNEHDSYTADNINTLLEYNPQQVATNVDLIIPKAKKTKEC